MSGEKVFNSINIFFKRYGSLIIIFCILLYIILFSLISYLKFVSFSYIDVDLSAIEQVFWSTAHGKFIVGEFGDAALLGGGHFFLIIILLAPIYAIFAHPLTLLFMQTIVLAIPAYFIYIFARKKVDESFAFYFALAYLLYPALAYVNLFEFHLIAFAPLFLIPMFMFFEKRRFWLFILFMFLALSCKEDVFLAMFGLGIYGLFKYMRFKQPFIRKEHYKWCAVPLIAGVLWFILVIKFIQPYFILAELKEVSDSRGVLAFYGWLGNTPGEIIKNIFLHPKELLQGIFIPAKVKYLLLLFGPLAFLSLLGFKEMIIVAFILLESLLSQRTTHFSINFQYSAMVTPFIFISAIFGLRRLLQFKLLKRSKLHILIILLSISLFCAFNFGPLFKLSLERWKPDTRDALKEDFVKLIPPEAAVATTFELGTRLTHRDKLFFIYHINIIDWSGPYAYLAEKYGEKSDYLLIDFLDQLTYFGFYYQNSDIFLKDFLEQYSWSVLYEMDNIALWIKGEDGSDQLIERIDEFPQDLAGLSFANEHIKFVGVKFNEREVLDRLVLHVESYLESQKATTKRYVLLLDFYDKGTKELLYRHSFIAADRIYPTKRWQVGEKIKISQNVFIPESIKLEDCDIALNLGLMR